MGIRKDLNIMKRDFPTVSPVGTKTRHGAIMRNFGCLKCSWSGTDLCIHKITRGGHHSNWICGDRIKYLQEEYKKCGSMVKLVQQQELFKLTQISDWLLNEFYEHGELDGEFKHISKLIVSLTDKVRRQDEGIKISGEVTLAHEDFKKMVEIEAKKIEEQNKRTRPAEFTEEVQTS